MPEFRGLSLQSRLFASSSLARFEVAPFSTRSPSHERRKMAFARNCKWNINPQFAPTLRNNSFRNVWNRLNCRNGCFWSD
jgi:hypothetical protein